MELVKYPNDILTTPTQQFDFANPPQDPYELAKVMIEKMNDFKGIGLSANQVGIPYRVFVMRGLEHNFACFNPKLVFKSDEENLLEEGCLSFPGVNVKLKRSNTVRLRFQTPSGGIDTKTFDGLTARVVQHELDHLNGILFFNRANKYHRDKALKGFYNGK
jgi:peptide deformylase